jgi:hypothetical protein
MKWLAFALVLTGCTADTFTGLDGATPTDGGGAGDAPNEAGVDDGGDASCTPTPVACNAGSSCSSFDDQQTTPFSDLSQSPGKIAFTSNPAKTCPYSLVVTMPAVGTAAQARAGIGYEAQVAPFPTMTAHVEMDIILPSTVTGPSTFVGLFANGASTSGIGFESTGSKWIIHNHVTDASAAVSPRTGVWNHVAIDVTFSAVNSLGAVKLTYDDASGSPATASLPTDSTLPGGTATVSSVSFSAGIFPVSTSAPMTCWIDDVVFTP